MSDSSHIYIGGIDRDKLLQKLWEKSKPAPFFQMTQITPPPFDLIVAKMMINNGYADYICGRVIKAYIYSTDYADPRGYDQTNGAGAFQKVVDQFTQ